MTVLDFMVTDNLANIIPELERFCNCDCQKYNILGSYSRLLSLSPFPLLYNKVTLHLFHVSEVA